MKCNREGCNKEVGTLLKWGEKHNLPYCEEHWFETWNRELWK